MAEYVVIPERHLVPVPVGLDLSLAALREPLSVAVHAVLVRSAIRTGHRVVVSGPGPIGILCAMVTRLAGADVVVTGVGSDSVLRLPAAERAGLRTANSDEASLEEHLLANFGERAPDAWVEGSGSVRALDSALDAVRPGGTITVVGIYADRMEFFPTPAVQAELDVLFSFASSYADYEVALDLLASGAIEPRPLVSEYPLEAAPRAFDEANAGRAIKAMLIPQATKNQ